MWKYLCFLWRSKNEHAVHSPFVFSLVTKCFYTKKKRKKTFPIRKKQILFLEKLHEYFQFKTAAFFLKKTDLQQIKTFFPWDENSEKKDIILVDDSVKISLEILIQKMHNDSLLLFLSPYATKNSEKKWKEIVENHKIIVTIDTFLFGLAFIRKEQQKQHFIIRL